MLRRMFLAAPLPFFLPKLAPNQRACPGPKKEEPVVNAFGPKVVFQSHQDVSVVNSTAVTTLFEYSIPARTLAQDHGIRATIHGAWWNGAADADVHSAAVTVWLNSDLLMSFFIPIPYNPIGGPGFTGAPWVIRLDVTAKGEADAAYGAQEAFAELIANQITTPWSRLFYGESAEDGTEEITLAVKVALDEADANLQVRKMKATIETL